MRISARTMIHLVSVVWLALALVACAGQAEPETAVPSSATSAPAEPVAGEPVHVGILVNRSAVATSTQHEPLMQYLTLAVGRPFVIVPLGFEEQFTAVEQDTVDFVFSNPVAAVQLQRLYGTEFLATISYVDTGIQFSGLIIASSDSGIADVSDLYGKRAACLDFETAAAGCLFQVYHLQQQGFDAFTDFSSFTEIPSQDNIVLGVLNGTIDVGFIRTGQLEKMISDGSLPGLDAITIIDRADDTYPYPHTTQLYPEWCFAALASTDPGLALQVQEVLLTIPADHSLLETLGAEGFVSPADYNSIHKLIVEMQLLSWDAAE